MPYLNFFLVNNINLGKQQCELLKMGSQLGLLLPRTGFQFAALAISITLASHRLGIGFYLLTQVRRGQVTEMLRLLRRSALHGLGCSGSHLPLCGRGTQCVRVATGV